MSIQTPRPKIRSPLRRRGGCVQKKLSDAVTRKRETSRTVGRGLRERRASARPEAGYAASLAPIGERRSARASSFRLALRHRLVSPASGRPSGMCSDGVSKRSSRRCSEPSARRGRAGLHRTIILSSTTPDGMAKRAYTFQGRKLVLSPAYTPDLQPAETLWALVDEPIVNKHVETIHELDEIIRQRCGALATNATPSRAAPAFTGGQNRQCETNQPEMVSSFEANSAC